MVCNVWRWRLINSTLSLREKYLLPNQDKIKKKNYRQYDFLIIYQQNVNLHRKTEYFDWHMFQPFELKQI